MTFTKERAAVETLESKGYTWHGGQFWKPPIGKAPAYIKGEQSVVTPDAAVESLSTDLMKRIDKITGERHSIATLSSLRVSIVEACRAAMLQGAIVGNAPAHYGLRPEQNNCSPAQTPIDHGYRPDCECSGCRGLAEICSGLNGNSPVNTGCWCHACRPVTMNDMRLVVCPTCGNKRCPHANDHRNACTGSNEPGQEGSAYPAAPQQEADNG